MPLDGLFLNFLKEEILSFAQGSKVDKVHQPTKNELVLLLRRRSGNKRLLLSVGADNPRLSFIANPPENPQNPPMFCMLLRKHLTGAVLKDIRQDGLDRLLFLDFDAMTEIGQKTKLTLCLELIPRQANIILVNEEGLILDAIKRVDGEKSKIRQVLPAMVYEKPPAQDKVNILDYGADDILAKALTYENLNASSALLASAQGFSPLIARELADYAYASDVKLNDFTPQALEKLKGKLLELKNMLEKNEHKAVLLAQKDGKPIDFSFMPIYQYGSLYEQKVFESLSDLLEFFYERRGNLERTRQSSADLGKFLNTAIARTARTLALRQEELKKSEDREELRVFAELISANQGRLEKGAVLYELENYYDENKLIRIPADPALSPVANSQKYYKAYRKAKNAEKILKNLIGRARSELAYLESVAEALQRAGTRAEVEEIRAELREQGYLKKQKKKTQRTVKALPPYQYVSPDGFKVLVGRNNMQNDRLTLKQARKNDIWLHVQKMPGSHVIIISEGMEVPDSTLLFAAQIAAYHSAGRDSSKVPVDYTAAGLVKKPAGALPGKVIYKAHKTLLVQPKIPKDKAEAH
ncbi:MAG: fibronectin/fibrinogen-binding protein [Clostridiales bacterium]|nr:fibronectin/fibrinogen-binding protein [Clostridiales bacterium]